MHKESSTATGQAALKRGLRIQVYQRPITKEQPEGVAVLRRLEGFGSESYYPEGVSGEERKIALWSVQFKDGAVVDRWVSEQDLLP